MQYRKQQAIKKYQRNLLDHGSPAIQCALMSEEIILLMNHVTRYPKDKRAGRFLTKLIQKRRNMLNYCMRKDYHRYKWVCVDYGIPDVHPKNSHHMTSWERFYNNWSGYWYHYILISNQKSKFSSYIPKSKYSLMAFFGIPNSPSRPLKLVLRASRWFFTSANDGYFN